MNDARRIETVDQLTPEQKQRIDILTYEQLLYAWRFAPVGDPQFQGEAGKYWAQRMAQLRNTPNGDKEHTQASKSIGWEKS